jgi:hypothetical protein
MTFEVLKVREKTCMLFLHYLIMLEEGNKHDY